jgi:multidrug efflux pump subunit AcrB
MTVSNIGSTPDFSAIYTTNSAMHTAFVQVSLKEDHQLGSYEYMARVKEKLATELPELSAYFQSGGLVDAVLNLGLPAPIDVQVAGSNMENSYATALKLASRIRQIPGGRRTHSGDIDYPALQLDVDRTQASEMGLDQREVVNNVITALTSNQMIAPSFWIDPKTGNDYMLTVQYSENQVKSLTDLKSIPLRGTGAAESTRLDMISHITRITSPTEVDHYQLRRTVDIYVRPLGEDLGKIATAIDQLIGRTKVPAGLMVTLRGMVQGMRASFQSFGLGLSLSVILLYLILVAQFRSFIDPFIILIAVPPAITGVMLTLWATETTLNVMSLMGVVMLAGIAVSNSILIVEFTRRLREDGIRRELSRSRRVDCAGADDVLAIIGRADGVEARKQPVLCATGSRHLRGAAVSVILTVFLCPRHIC